MTTIDMRPVFYFIGALMVVLGLAMVIPLIYDFMVGSSDWWAFARASMICVFFGFGLVFTNSGYSENLTIRQTFLLTTFSWIVISLFSSLPFVFSEVEISYSTSIFEAVSGITSTGSTAFDDLESLSRGLLLWRSVLQWIGGIGIIGMGVAILPFLRIGGMQLFRTESSDRSDKIYPKSSDYAIAICWVYLAMTLVTIFALKIGGMTFFDAICHGFTSISTAGFSTRNASIGAFNNPKIEYVLMFAMLAGALPFVRLLSFAKGEFKPLFLDSQVKAFFLIVFAFVLIVAVFLKFVNHLDFADAFRFSAFNVISIINTTGYTTADYTEWGKAAAALFFILMFIGGCTGSTSGGVKVFRFQLLVMSLKAQLVKLYNPHRILSQKYNDLPVDTPIMLSVTAYVFVLVVTILFVTVLLAGMGLSFITAISGATTALTNVGPGLGPVIGPAGNFHSLPDASKWILSICMILGRLEFFTILVLFNPGCWQE